MTMHMPQELEVWYLLPALRRELTRIFVEELKMSQKQAADLLGLTQAAVSQYLHTKRGSDFKFSEDEVAQIRKEAQEIRKKPTDVMRVLHNLCKKMMGGKTMCDFHRKMDGSLPEKCTVCREAA